jgi:hypothetical protein
MWEPTNSIVDACDVSFYDVVERFGHNFPLHTFLSMMRKWCSHVKGGGIAGENGGRLVLATECLSGTFETQEYADQLSSKIGEATTCIFYRLSLFVHRGAVPAEIGALAEDSLLGTAVVTRIGCSLGAPYVLDECIVKHPPLLNNYVHVQRNHTRSILGRDFTIQGTYFCQQDSLLGVCAHAAARMYLLNHPDGPVDPPPYYHINDHILRLTPERIKSFGVEGGLSADEITSILAHYGLRAWCHDYGEEADRDCAWDVYSGVEQSRPALLVFRTINPDVQHVVVTVGHTLNTDLWLPQARPHYFLRESQGLHHYDSTMWVQDFIVQDDNFGMLLCLPCAALSSGLDTSVIRDPNEDAAPRQGFGTFCIIDKAGNVDGAKAEVLALDILYHLMREMSDVDLSDNIWLGRLRDVAKNSKMGPVARHFLANKSDYVVHLKAVHDRAGIRLEEEFAALAEQKLPDRFWLTELTLPHLFTANRRKLGDVVCSCEDPRGDQLHGEPQVLLVRLPGLFSVIGEAPSLSGLMGHVQMFCKEISGPEW